MADTTKVREALLDAPAKGSDDIRSIPETVEGLALLLRAKAASEPTKLGHALLHAAANALVYRRAALDSAAQEGAGPVAIPVADWERSSMATIARALRAGTMHKSLIDDAATWLEKFAATPVPSAHDAEGKVDDAMVERDAASEHARQQDERVLRLTEANEALIRERDELRAEIANLKDSGCEYRITSHEGTSYCQLAESSVKRLTEERDELARRIAEAQRATIDHYAEHAILDNCIRNGLSEGQRVAIVPLGEGE